MKKKGEVNWDTIYHCTMHGIVIINHLLIYPIFFEARKIELIETMPP